MKIAIRRARAGEAAALTDLSMRSKASNGYDDAFMNACRAELEVTPERMASAEYWVAADEAIRGCISLTASEEPGAGEIGAFFIDPDFQRRGIGRMLWDAARRSAEARGFRVLRLDSDPFAVPFYQTLGFAIAGEVASGSIPGRIIPQMEIRLS
ncbi:GNAT family N-acetyltransferase [Pikeienuella piscinae]|uniref:GNAT family N-acetyltransferase n=1 Tax=Pikeienuella piscinae TaxID=2748098 RepID=A0A7L5C262_9RHOB|nr:GNAT family N-acetyltransferase [Pikeienuella piscinae]QIE55959.1 GNAT family N-acetyltransferase [Pikeienuella piscinae]